MNRLAGSPIRVRALFLLQLTTVDIVCVILCLPFCRDPQGQALSDASLCSQLPGLSQAPSRSQKGCFGCNIAFPVSQTKRAFVQGSVLSATALEELAQNWEMARLHLQLDEQIHTFWMQM